MARLTGKKLEARLRSARSLLTDAARRDFGRGELDLKNERFIASNGNWALRYRYRADGSFGSDGHVEIERIKR